MTLRLFFPETPLAYYAMLALCGAVFLFLLAPILVIAPLSFNSEPYFTYPIESYSTRWYEAFFSSEKWLGAAKNSLLIAVATALLSTVIGTLAALGLSRFSERASVALQGLLISPLVLPIVVTAVGLYFFYVRIGLGQTFVALILAHTTIAAPFVVVTVTAALANFDWTLLRAAASLGASPRQAFRSVMLPLILPGVLSGALFAFIASFDDLVIALFMAGTQQRTLPKQMWSGIRENLDPTIIAVATMLVMLSVIAVVSLELIRRRNERMRQRS